MVDQLISKLPCGTNLIHKLRKSRGSAYYEYSKMGWLGRREFYWQILGRVGRQVGREKRSKEKAKSLGPERSQWTHMIVFRTNQKDPAAFYQNKHSEKNKQGNHYYSIKKENESGNEIRGRKNIRNAICERW